MSPQEAARLVGYELGGTDMSKHTPTPWEVVPDTLGTIRAFNGVDVAQAQQVRPDERMTKHAERLANAAYIVRAVNAHEGLAEALRLIATSAPGVTTGHMRVVAGRALRAAGVEP